MAAVVRISREKGGDGNADAQVEGLPTGPARPGSPGGIVPVEERTQRPQKGLMQSLSTKGGERVGPRPSRPGNVDILGGPIRKKHDRTAPKVGRLFMSHLLDVAKEPPVYKKLGSFVREIREANDRSRERLRRHSLTKKGCFFNR